MNDDKLQRKAETLASEKYLTIVRTEPEGEGVPEYMALHPGLPGCVAQGNTVREARASLDEATVFWIRCLLEDNLPVPDPMALGGGWLKL
jgi:predicted RNase H-like HicB family nuclease